jgi:hypothetical protein
MCRRTPAHGEGPFYIRSTYSGHQRSGAPAAEVVPNRTRAIALLGLQRSNGQPQAPAQSQCARSASRTGMRDNKNNSALNRFFGTTSEDPHPPRSPDWDPDRLGAKARAGRRTTPCCMWQPQHGEHETIAPQGTLSRPSQAHPCPPPLPPAAPSRCAPASRPEWRLRPRARRGNTYVRGGARAGPGHVAERCGPAGIRRRSCTEAAMPRESRVSVN